MPNTFKKKKREGISPAPEEKNYRVT